ncbi:MAG: hypothetical protein K8R58_06635 [Bacteroidales bacterium]|nr:hypothetical protein [Bacteroidales bacterium]
MDDFIYILLGLAWLVYAIYSKGQKKKKIQTSQVQQQGQTETVETKNKVKSILEEFLLGEEFENKQYQEAEIYKPTVEIFPDEQKSQFIDTEPIITKPDKELYEPALRVEDKGKEIIEDIEIRDKYDEYEKQEIDFDLKKAIIFSEILKRPYT